MQRFLRQMCGYFLTGSTKEEKLFFLHSAGGNGKGVFVSAISKIMGGYAKNAPMQTFTASKHERYLTESHACRMPASS